MSVTTIDIDPKTLARAKELTGSTSNKAVVDLALRRLIAGQQKRAMIEGIRTLTDLPEGLGAPRNEYPVSPKTNSTVT